jgi:hypothetical protein
MRWDFEGLLKRVPASSETLACLFNVMRQILLQPIWRPIENRLLDDTLQRFLWSALPADFRTTCTTSGASHNTAVQFPEGQRSKSQGDSPPPQPVPSDPQRAALLGARIDRALPTKSPDDDSARRHLSETVGDWNRFRALDKIRSDPGRVTRQLFPGTLFRPTRYSPSLFGRTTSTDLPMTPFRDNGAGAHNKRNHGPIAG